MTDRYFAGVELPGPGETILLPGEESHHLIKVMRVRPGTPIRVFSNGQEAWALFQAVAGKQAELVIGEPLSAPVPPSVAVHFAIPWIKGGRTELVLQKLTELGAASFSIFHAKREVMKGSDDKLERLRRVVLDACKQCERADVPEVREASDLAGAVGSSGLTRSHSFLLYEREGSLLLGTALRRVDLGNGEVTSLYIASGPEGGFAPEELQAVQDLATPVSLGPRILRAETAPIAALAAALTISGDL